MATVYETCRCKFRGYYTNYTAQILVPIDYTMADRLRHWIPIANTCAYSIINTQHHYATMYYNIPTRWVYSELTSSYPLRGVITQHAHSLYILPMLTHHRIHVAFEKVTHRAHTACLYVCLSVCRSFRDLQPITIDRSQPNLVGRYIRYLSSHAYKPFWIP